MSTVSVTVPGSGPYGITIESDRFGHAAVLKSWVRLPTGKFGAVQKHGGVSLGDVLVVVNDVSVVNAPFADVKAMLGKSGSGSGTAVKVLKFQSSAEYYGKKKSGVVAGKNITGGKEAGSSKNSFLSIIKRARVNNFASTKFGEYEIVCQLKLASVSVDKDKTFKWSVWKRYSDFEQLDNQLRKSLGWHMDTISFPSSHTFVMSKLSPDFLEQRREELNEYWLKVIAIDKVTEFNKHHCSAALKSFIDVDGALLGEKASASAAESTTKETTENESTGDEGTKTQAKRNSTRRLSARSGSNKSMMRRGSSASGSTKSIGGTDGTPSSSTISSSTSPTSQSPPPTPSVTATPPPTASSGGSSKPPLATGARANLLGSIAALRKD